MEGCLGRYIGQVHNPKGDLVATIYPNSNTAVTEEGGLQEYSNQARVS